MALHQNRVNLIGNLVKKPVLRQTPGGKSVCTFRMATNRQYVDRQTGEKREDAQYHTIVSWGRDAENHAKYLVKGQQVGVEGELRTRQWEDKNGSTHWTTEIVSRPGGVQYGNKPASAQQPADQELPPEAPESDEELPADVADLFE